MLERASCPSIVLLPTDSISCHFLSLSRTCCSSEWWRIWNIKLYFPTPQIKPSRRTWLCPNSLLLLNFSATQSPKHFYIWSHISSTRLIDTNDFHLLSMWSSKDISWFQNSDFHSSDGNHPPESWHGVSRGVWNSHPSFPCTLWLGIISLWLSLANTCSHRYTTFTNRYLQLNIHDAQHYPRVFPIKKWPALSFKASITL